MNFKEIKITELLPQRPPFVFVEELIYCDSKKCETAFTIKQESYFVKSDHFQGPGLVENIAQTCATLIGFYNKYTNNGNIKLGFIGGIKNLQIERLPFIGEQLHTTVETVADIGPAKIANASIYIDGKLIASGEMKIFEQE